MKRNLIIAITVTAACLLPACSRAGRDTTAAEGSPPPMSCSGLTNPVLLTGQKVTVFAKFVKREEVLDIAVDMATGRQGEPRKRVVDLYRCVGLTPEDTTLAGVYVGGVIGDRPGPSDRIRLITGVVSGGIHLPLQPPDPTTTQVAQLELVQFGR